MEDRISYQNKLNLAKREIKLRAIKRGKYISDRQAEEIAIKTLEKYPEGIQKVTDPELITKLNERAGL
jgi:hypothetical protein